MRLLITTIVTIVAYIVIGTLKKERKEEDRFLSKVNEATKSDGETDKHPEATNQNTAMLTYATDRTMEHDYYSNTTKVFTYEIDLTKLFTDGTAGYVSKNDENGTSFDYSQVKFTVRGSVSEGSEDYALSSGEWEDLHFLKLSDGHYQVLDEFSTGEKYDTYATDDTLEQASGEKTITKYVTPSSTGLLSITGLDARTYEFTEVATATGRNLMADEFYVELVAPVVDGKTLENGTIEHAYVWTGTKPTDNLSDYDLAASNVNVTRMDEGRVPFTVQNNEVIKILKTGGAGTYMFWIAGGLGLAACGTAAYFHFKKKDEEADSEA